MLFLVLTRYFRIRSKIGQHFTPGLTVAYPSSSKGRIRRIADCERRELKARIGSPVAYFEVRRSISRCRHRRATQVRLRRSTVHLKRDNWRAGGQTRLCYKSLRYTRSIRPDPSYSILSVQRASRERPGNGTEDRDFGTGLIPEPNRAFPGRFQEDAAPKIKMYSYE